MAIAVTVELRKWFASCNSAVMAKLFRSSLLSATALFRLIALGALFWLLYFCANRWVAPQHLPWKALDINAPIGLATKTQLMKVSLGNRASCMAMFQSEANETQFKTLEPKDGPRSCGWTMALDIDRNNGIHFTPSGVTMLCPLSAASYIWLREVDASAKAFLGSGLKRVHHFGTYSCRNIAGSNQLSEHAFANAWDVSGFELDDARLISIRTDWSGKPMEAAFLREAKAKACKIFRVTLSPDYNAAHHDHFHLDMGPSRSCR